MNEVHVVVKNIDLGYHIEAVWLSKEQADTHCEELNRVMRAKFPSQVRPMYEVETHMIIDGGEA